MEITKKWQKELNEYKRDLASKEREHDKFFNDLDNMKRNNNSVSYVRYWLEGKNAKHIDFLIDLFDIK